jgi:hypothetical protein
MARYKVPGSSLLKSKSFSFDSPFECEDMIFQTLLKGKFDEAESFVDLVYSQL